MTSSIGGPGGPRPSVGSATTNVQSEETPVINLTGQKVSLGPLRKDLLPLYHRWLNDLEVIRTLNIGIRPRRLESEEAWYEDTLEDSSEVSFTVYDRESLQPIGITDLHRISQIDQRSEFGIHIGDKEHWDRGYGTEATALTLDYGFNALNLHTILLRVFSYNERAIKVYERVGFKPVGRWRGAHRVGGRAFDVIFMDCLATEFTSLQVRDLLMGDAE